MNHTDAHIAPNVLKIELKKKINEVRIVITL